ncbi:MAG: hypothetical protein ABI618_15565 [Nitrospirota bacterium]
MKKTQIDLLIGFMTILTGVSCISDPVKWYKSGTSQETFTRDKSDCQEALLSTGSTQREKDIYSLEGCLESKGYTAIPLSSQ